MKKNVSEMKVYEIDKDWRKNISQFIIDIESIRPELIQNFYFESKLKEFKENDTQQSQSEMDELPLKQLEKERKYFIDYLNLMTKKIKTPHPFIENSHFFVNIVSNISRKMYEIEKFLIDPNNEKLFHEAVRFLRKRENIDSYLKLNINNCDLLSLSNGSDIIENAVERLQKEVFDASLLEKHNKDIKKIRELLETMAKEVGIVAQLDENDGVDFYYDVMRVFKESFLVPNPFDPDKSILEEDVDRVANVFNEMCPKNTNVEIIFESILSSETKDAKKYISLDIYDIPENEAKTYVSSYKTLRYVLQKRRMQDIMETIKILQGMKAKMKEKDPQSTEEMIQSYFTRTLNELMASCTKLLMNNPSIDINSFVITLFDAELHFERGKLKLLRVLNEIAENTNDEFIKNYMISLVNYRALQCSPMELPGSCILRLSGDKFYTIADKIRDLMNMHILNHRYNSSVLGELIGCPSTHQYSPEAVPTSPFEVFQSLKIIKKVLQAAPAAIQEVSEDYRVNVPLFNEFIDFGFWKSFKISKFPFPYSFADFRLMENSTNDVQSIFYSPFLDSKKDVSKFNQKNFLCFLKYAYKLRKLIIRTSILMETYSKQVNKSCIIYFAYGTFNFCSEKQIKDVTDKADFSLLIEMIKQQTKFNVLLEAIIVFNNISIKERFISNLETGKLKEVCKSFFLEGNNITGKIPLKRIEDIPVNEESLKQFLLQIELIKLASMERQFILINPMPNLFIMANERQQFIKDGNINQIAFPSSDVCYSITDSETLEKCVRFIASRFGFLHLARFFYASNQQFSYVIAFQYKNKITWKDPNLELITVDNVERLRVLYFLRFRIALLEEHQRYLLKRKASLFMKQLSETSLQDLSPNLKSFSSSRYSPSWTDRFCDNIVENKRAKIAAAMELIKATPPTEDTLFDLKYRMRTMYINLLYSLIKDGRDPSTISVHSIFDIDPNTFSENKKHLAASVLCFQLQGRSFDQYNAFAAVVNQECLNIKKQEAAVKKIPEFLFIKKPEFYRKSLRIEPLRAFYNTNSSEINRQFNQEMVYATHYINRLMHETMTLLNPALLDEFKFKISTFLESSSKVNRILNFYAEESQKKHIDTWKAYLSNMISDHQEVEIPNLVWNNFSKLILDTIEARYSYESSYKLSKEILKMNSLEGLIKERHAADKKIKHELQTQYKEEIIKLLHDIREEKKSVNTRYKTTMNKIVDSGIDTVAKNQQQEEQDIEIKIPELVESLKKRIEKAKEEIKEMRDTIKKIRIIHPIVPFGVRKVYSQMIENNRQMIKFANRGIWESRMSWVIEEQEINIKLKTNLRTLTTIEWNAEDKRQEIASTRLEIEQLKNSNTLTQKRLDELEEAIKSFGIDVADDTESLMNKVIAAQDELDAIEEESEKMDETFEYQVREPMQRCKEMEQKRKRIEYQNTMIIHEKMKKMEDAKKENESLKKENAQLKDRILAIQKQMEFQEQFSPKKAKSPVKTPTIKSTKPVIVSPRRRKNPKIL